MSRMSTVGRRGIVAVFAATIITTAAACGTDTGNDTGTEVKDSVPYAPGAVAPFIPTPSSGTSADAAERRGATEEPTPVTPAEKEPGPHGMRIPD